MRIFKPLCEYIDDKVGSSKDFFNFIFQPNKKIENQENMNNSN
jgi:hypothetical protein